MWAGATTRAPPAPAGRSQGGTPGGSPTGVAQGGESAPDGARRQQAADLSRRSAVVTGPYGATPSPSAMPGDLCYLAAELFVLG